MVEFGERIQNYQLSAELAEWLKMVRGILTFIHKKQSML